LLIGLNLWGLFAPAGLPHGVHKWNVPAGQEFLTRASLTQAANEADQTYFRRLTLSVHYRMTHYWRAGHERVPLRENYLLSAMGLISPTYRAYEFTGAAPALRRGFGFCSQFSNVVFDELRRQHFYRQTVLLPHHTVAVARTRSGQEMILDADFGTVVPHSLAAVLRNPTLLRPFYAHLNPASTPTPHLTPAGIVGVLEADFRDKPFAINTGRATRRTAVVEPIAYILKWVIPSGLLLLAAIIIALHVRRGRRRSARGHQPIASPA